LEFPLLTRASRTEDPGAPTVSVRGFASPDTSPPLPPVHPASATSAVALASDHLACLHGFAAASNWPGGVAAVLSRVQTRLGAYRVSLGWRRGPDILLQAWSDVDPLQEGVGVPELEAACQEARDWSQAACWPACAGQTLSEQQLHAHLALFKSQGLTAVLSAPLRDEQGVVQGVLVCERIPMLDAHSARSASWPTEGTAGFSVAERDWLQALASLLGPVMGMRHHLEQPWYMRGWSRLSVLGQRLGDPRERWLRGSVLAAFGVGSFLLGWPFAYTLAVPARLEARSQTAIVAPADAVVEQSVVHVGELVRAGQPMARLSSQPAVRPWQALGEQLLQAQAQLDQAQAQGEPRAMARLEAVITDLKQRMDANEPARLGMTLSAPFDGVVMAQHAGGQAGAQVRRGDALWVVSPGLDWRVVLEVDEAVVAALAPGQHAMLRLPSAPNRAVHLMLGRAVPAAVEGDGGVRFDLDAQVTGGAMAGLRPGLRGVVHVDMPPASMLDRGVQALRSWWWVAMWGVW
jgi:Barrel-sandwich domain of CusB or HlyD membrane-fusion